MNRHHRRLVASFALFLASCRGCQKDTGSLVDLAAPDARAVVMVPSLTTLAKNLGAFTSAATKRAGKEALDGARRSLVEQLGFDPFTPKGFKASGVDPDRGIVMFTEGNAAQAILAVHVDDRAAFGNWLKGMAQRAGASKVTSETRDGVTFDLASRPFGTESAPTLAWGFVGDDALIASADAIDSFVVAMKRLGTRQSGAAVASTPLTKDPTYLALSSKVEGGDVRVFARGAPPVDGEKAQSAGIVASLSLGGTGLRLDSFVDFKVEGLAAALDGEPPLPLGKRVEDDAVAVALTRIAKPEGIAALRGSPLTKNGVEQALDRFKRATQLDLENDLMKVLAGPLTVGVHVMDLNDLPQALARRLGMNAVLEFVHVTISAEVKDREALITLLDRSKGQLEEQGNKVNKRSATIGGKEAVIYEPSGDRPSIGWGVIDNFYVYGAGRGRIERAMAQVLPQAPGGVAPKLTSGVANELGQARGSFLVVVRAAALADNVAKLQKSQDAVVMAVMPMVSQGIEVLRTIGDVAVAAKVEKDGVRIEARQKLQ
ncbi:MAG TPA: hypothetical protein VLC93_00325 [Myxococcota bacterium]|nr:hypothetical protein [Myxococcota bacterium]